MPCRACAQCGAEFPCAPSFRGKVPKCSGCRGARGGRQHGTAPAGSAPKTGAAGAPQPRHMTPCACHCAACRAAGHGGKHGVCVVLCAGLHGLFDGKAAADVVDLVLRHYYRACGWGTAHFDAAISCVQYGTAGDVLAAGDSDGRIHFICAQTGKKILCPLNVGSGVNSVQFNTRGDTVAAGCDNGTVQIIDVATAEVKRPHVGSRVNSVAYSPDGTTLAAGLHFPSNVLILDAQSGKIKSSLNVDSTVWSVQFSPAGDIVAAGCRGGTVQLIDVATAEVKRPLSCDSSVLSIDWHENRIVAGCYAGTIQVFDAQSGDRLSTVRGHSARVNCVDFSPDGLTIASGSGERFGNDTSVRVWDVKTGKQLWQLRGHTDVVTSVCFSSDGKELTSGSDDSTVRNWDP